jgi:hypothetical protein
MEDAAQLARKTALAEGHARALSITRTQSVPALDRPQLFLALDRGCPRPGLLYSAQMKAKPRVQPRLLPTAAQMLTSCQPHPKYMQPKPLPTAAQMLASRQLSKPRMTPQQQLEAVLDGTSTFDAHGPSMRAPKPSIETTDSLDELTKQQQTPLQKPKYRPSHLGGMREIPSSESMPKLQTKHLYPHESGLNSNLILHESNTVFTLVDVRKRRCSTPTRFFLPCGVPSPLR